MNTQLPRHFVFVPGSFHASWCWSKMHPLLQDSQSSSVAIDLPAHGHDTTAIADVTLDSYVNSVCRVVESYETPVILIGHSRAGIIISQVAERLPDRISCLVYLCAYLIPHGEPMIATALQDADSALVAGLILNEQEGWHFPAEHVVRDAFYNDCSDADVATATPLLCREPNAPVGTPLNLTDAAYGSVRKVYIRTSMDRTISPQLQQHMLDRIPVNEIFELNSGHSPFISVPRDLASILRSL